MIMSTLTDIADELKQISDYAAEAKAIRMMQAEMIEQLRKVKTNQSNPNPFEFVLKNDYQGFADDSWQEIIKAGQSIQSKYRDKSETYWQNKIGDSPSGDGWYGSFEAPKIVIKCVEPVYRFKNTARLAGSFQLTSHAHMGSILRFEGTGDKCLHDKNGWWTQTDAKVGLYVEPSTLVDGRNVRNFEQSIRNVTIVGQLGSMPIYIADNAFNFRLSDCNIQAHQGSNVIVKHGPSIDADWYPVTQKPSGNNYLPDPIFSNCLIEGRHKFHRRNVGICVSGNNIQFHGLNFYGTLTGIMSTGQGRTVSACSMHHGATHDGRTWCKKDQLALGILSRRSDENADSIQINPSFPIVNPIKRTRATEDRGWYEKGEAYI